jgi:hypothetical protein
VRRLQVHRQWACAHGTGFARVLGVIVAVHQPAFMPWLGYLDKMAKADVFVVLDDLPFDPNDFQHRNRLKLDDGAAWLTVPIEAGRGVQRIVDKTIDNTCDWQLEMWRALEIHYQHAPSWLPYADELFDVFSRPWRNLVDLDLHMIGVARRWLGITTPILRASSFGLTGTMSERLIALCQQLGARAYLSGTGHSLKYLDAERMGRAGLGVIWQHFEHPIYPQRYPDIGFVSRLGFLDLVFNCGEDSRQILFGNGHPVHLHREALDHQNFETAQV